MKLLLGYILLIPLAIVMFSCLFVLIYYAYVSGNFINFPLLKVGSVLILGFVIKKMFEVGCKIILENESKK